jgi:predicted DNA-binding ribbon-helix-helix protein
MAKTEFSKVQIKKADSTLEFTTEEYLFEALKLITAKSQLPIKQLLAFINDNQVDTISCSRDDTNYSFFARSRNDKISIIIKQLGEQTMEFELSRNKIKDYALEPPFL